MGRHLLLTLTRDYIQLWTWVDPLSRASLHLTQPDLYIPLKGVTEAIQSFFFTPGLHFDGSRISFIRQRPMFDTQTIGDADIVILDANTEKVVHNVHVNQKIRKLLAIGSRYAVLLPFVDNKYKNGRGGSGEEGDSWRSHSAPQQSQHPRLQPGTTIYFW